MQTKKKGFVARICAQETFNEKMGLIKLEDADILLRKTFLITASDNNVHVIFLRHVILGKLETEF